MKGLSEAIDDLRAGQSVVTTEGADGFDIVLSLAERYGIAPDVLIGELSGSSALARISRDLLGLQFLAPAGRGRPADDMKNWQMYTAIRVLRASGLSLDEAIAAHLLANGKDDEDGILHDTTKRHFNRLKKKWPEHPVKLADLFSGPPQ